jgi:hypothetical protein
LLPNDKDIRISLNFKAIVILYALLVIRLLPASCMLSVVENLLKKSAISACRSDYPIHSYESEIAKRGAVPGLKCESLAPREKESSDEL